MKRIGLPALVLGVAMVMPVTATPSASAGPNTCQMSNQAYNAAVKIHFQGQTIMRLRTKVNGQRSVIRALRQRLARKTA